MIRILVPPDQHIGYGNARNGFRKLFGPPFRLGGVVFKPGLRESERFVFQIGDMFEQAHQSQAVGLDSPRAAVIGIQTEYVDISVARPELEVIVLRTDDIGRVDIQQVMHAFRIAQVFERKTPQGDVLFSGAVALAPPETVAGVFVERAEQHRDILPVNSLEREHEIGDLVQPAAVFPVQVAAGNDPPHGRSHVPCRAAGNGVGRMPADGGHTAAGISLENTAANVIEPVAVDIGILSEFDLGQIPAHHCGIVAADTLHIRAVGIARPADTIERRTLVPEKRTAVFGNAAQIAEQITGLHRSLRVGRRSGSRLGFRIFAVGNITASGHDQTRQIKNLFPHNYQLF